MISEQQERQHLTLYFIFLSVAATLLLVTASMYPELQWVSVLAGFLGFCAAVAALSFLTIAVWTWRHRNDG